MALSLIAMSAAQAQTYSRTDTITYEDNLALWVIGQQKTSTNVNTGLIESRTDYDPVTALPIRTFAFGKLQQTLTYDTTSAVSTGQRGTLKTVSDGRDAYGQHHDHVLQLEARHPAVDPVSGNAGRPPSGSNKSAVVNDNGWITSVTDENGYKTCYGYDAMGRLDNITYPSETQLGRVQYKQLEPRPLSLCARCQWLSTASLPATGSRRSAPAMVGRSLITMRMWRPLVSERYDTADIAGTLSQTVTRYDADGHAVYQSYPMQGPDRLHRANSRASAPPTTPGSRHPRRAGFRTGRAGDALPNTWAASRPASPIRASR